MFQTQSGINSDLDSVDYCYVPKPCIPCYYITRLINCTRSSDHLGVSCLCPIISSYSTRSPDHIGVIHLFPRFLTPRSDSLLFPWFLLHDSLSLLPPLYSCDIFAKVSLSWMYAASWRHHASLLRSPPCRPSLLCTPQKLAAAPPTMPPLPVISLCRLSPTEFLTLNALLLPWVFPISRLTSVSLALKWYASENPCVYPLPSYQFPPEDTPVVKPKISTARATTL